MAKTTLNSGDRAGLLRSCFQYQELAVGRGDNDTRCFILPARIRRIWYAEFVMIEFSQPAQCLFCPQRRKIALLMKLVLAGSVAVIMALLLFQPGNDRVSAPRGASVSRNAAPGTDGGVEVLAEGRPVTERLIADDAVSKRSAEIRVHARERFDAVQAQIRPLLDEKIVPLERAQKLLDQRHNEVLKTKVLVLGEGLFSGSVAAEAEGKQVLETLDKELRVLSEQRKLLADLKVAH
jgi:hypothetical protein